MFALGSKANSMCSSTLVGDFDKAPLGALKFNGATHDSLSDFYDIDNEQKYILFSLQSQFNALQNTHKQSLTNFAQTFDKLHKEMNSIDKKENFTVSVVLGKIKLGLKCELKIEYQTDSQLRSGRTKII